MNSFYDAHRLPLRALFTLLARTHAEGVEHMPATGGVVLVSNHLSWLDPWLLGVHFPRPLLFLAKEELFAFKPLGWYLQKAGTFPIRRGESDRNALRYAETLLRDGNVVMVFPEGHRSDSGGAQAPRAGAVLLAARSGTPILPVGIAGSENLRLKHLPGHARLGILSWPKVTVRVGQPIYVDRAGGGKARKHAADLVMRNIVTLLPPEYHGVYAESTREPSASTVH